MIRIALVHVTGNSFGIIDDGMYFTLVTDILTLLKFRLYRVNGFVKQICNYFFLDRKLYVCQKINQGRRKYFPNIFIGNNKLERDSKLVSTI